VVQLGAIYTSIGSPPPAMLDRLRAASALAAPPVRELVADLIRETTKRPRSCQLDKMFAYMPEDAIDLLKRLLRFDPEERPSATQLLKHYFFRNLGPLATPQTSPVAIDVSDIDNLEQGSMPLAALRAKLHDMTYPDLVWSHDTKPSAAP